MSVYSAPWYTPAVQRLLDLALEEDVGRGDVTTASVIEETQEAEAEIIERERAVVWAGRRRGGVHPLDWRTRVRTKVSDGDPIAPGGVVVSVRGPAAALLAGERTALNFLQHLSGIATLTQAFVSASEGAKIRVTDTRKTTPGLRALEKYAVRVGGGASHRSDLASGVLLKDNHIALVGSVREAVRRARANAPHVLRVVVEVDTLAQLDEALEAGAEGILLDNFQVRDMAEAVKRVRERRPQVVIEAPAASRSIASTTSARPASTASIGRDHAFGARDRFSCEIRPVEGARSFSTRSGASRAGWAGGRFLRSAGRRCSRLRRQLAGGDWWRRTRGSDGTGQRGGTTGGGAGTARRRGHRRRRRGTGGGNTGTAGTGTAGSGTGGGTAGSGTAGAGERHRGGGRAMHAERHLHATGAVGTAA